MSAPAEEARPRATPAEESLAAVALIRAYTARDLYTADRILACWATKGNGMNFAAMVASSAAVILTREAAGDRDGALRAADAALEAFKGVASRKLVLPPSLFEHPAAELSVDDSAQLCEDRRQPDHIA